MKTDVGSSFKPDDQRVLRRSFFYAFFKLKQLIYIYFIYKTLVLRHAALEITVIQQSSFSDCSSRQHFLDRLRALMHAA